MSELNQGPGPRTGPEHAGLPDLHGYWRTLWRRRWLAATFLVAVVAITAIVTLRQTRIFEATCTIIIELTAPRVLEQEQVRDVVEPGAGSFYFTREYYETQYKVLTSRAVAERVVDRLQLGSNAHFLGIEDTGDSVALEKARASRDPVQTVLRNLHIEPVKDSRVVRIRYEDRDPKLAALIANTLAEAYITENLSVKTTTTANAADWLEGQLAALEKKLDESGKQLFAFKRSHDIVATSWEDRQSMVSQRLTTVNDALTRIRVRKAELQARNDAIESLGNSLNDRSVEVESLPAISASNTIQALKVRYLDARAECADLSDRYLAKHPRVEACKTKLTETRQALRDEINTTLLAARREYRETVTTEKNLLTLLNGAKNDAFGLNQYEREYLELKRANDNNQRLYDLVLKRLKDAGVTGMLQASNVRILDRARPNSKPVRPDLLRNMALALLLGVLGGIGLAFAAEYIDSSVTTQEQIEEYLGLTFLGIVPSIDRSRQASAHELVVHTQPNSAVAECLRAVRTNLLFMSPEKPLKTILVTSAGPQEGKTTTSASLAITMAGSGNRVLLVDADMRRPRVHKVFGASSHVGLSSLMLGESTLADAVKETEIENLSILPCGPIPPNPAELLHTSAFSRLLAELASEFDRVIVDSPPIGVVADSAVIATKVDGTLLVLKAGKTSREMAKQAVRALRDVNAPLLGALLNDLDLQSQKYGRYAYYYGYGYYYGDGQSKRHDTPNASAPPA